MPYTGRKSQLLERGIQRNLESDFHVISLKITHVGGLSRIRNREFSFDYNALFSPIEKGLKKNFLKNFQYSKYDKHYTNYTTSKTCKNIFEE